MRIQIPCAKSKRIIFLKKDDSNNFKVHIKWLKRTYLVDWKIPWSVQSLQNYKQSYRLIHYSLPCFWVSPCPSHHFISACSAQLAQLPVRPPTFFPSQYSGTWTFNIEYLQYDSLIQFWEKISHLNIIWCK